MSTVHVVYDGQHDLDFNELFTAERVASLGISEGTEVTPANITQAQVKMALAQYFDRGLNEFNDHFVEINPNGNITVRQNTVFG